MNWRVTKKFRFSDNHISVELKPDFKLNSDTSIIGYQNFTKELWEKLWILTGEPKPVIEKCYVIGDVSSSFSVTTEMLEEAGVAFLVGTGNTENWATSTFIGDENHYFKTMTVSEMLDTFGIS